MGFLVRFKPKKCVLWRPCLVQSIEDPVLSRGWNVWRKGEEKSLSGTLKLAHRKKHSVTDECFGQSTTIVSSLSDECGDVLHAFFEM